jgi:predicted N-acetyltransferase YhbS
MADLTPPQITYTASHGADSAELTKRLMRDLYALNEQSANTEFTLTIPNDTGELIGGLIAATSYGWLLIKVLWVNQNQRRRGLGAQLMNDAVKRAAQIGCHGVWLDTSSPKAYAFYPALGFEVFGDIKNEAHQHPPTHQRWFLRKYIEQ